ncbi:hypothetical protein MNBD_GAMMA10-2355 [hydrothermal vent metagenome]|uniref:Glycosyl transferase family 1 domain-containing protein n=1 Tax=hydrothermal vent metagenome TaxID=652676 RepID=A0A3B0Y1G5_9ZZZZ
MMVIFLTVNAIIDVKKSNNQQHILWITENYPPSRGGMAQSCDRIVENLKQKNILIDIIHFMPGKHRIKAEVKAQGQYIRCYLDGDYGHAMNCLWNFIQNNPDQNYSHVVCFGGYYSMKAAPLYAAWLDKPLVTMLRGNDFDAAIFSTRKQSVLLQALEQSTKISCVCQDMSHKVNRLIKNNKAAFIGNGINLDHWHALPSNHSNAQRWRSKNACKDKLVLGVFGHIKLKKGVDFFLQTLQKSGYADRIHCLLVGDFDEAVKQTLDSSPNNSPNNSLDNSLDNSQEISYSLLPFKDRYELVDYYLSCDIIAIPSFYDGMPNVLLEAGGLGIPVIASNTSGMKDLLEDGVHGYLFNPGDFNQCRHAIYQLLNTSKKQLKSYGGALKQNIAQHYNDTIETQNYINLFNQAISKYTNETQENQNISFGVGGP